MQSPLSNEQTFFILGMLASFISAIARMFETYSVLTKVGVIRTLADAITCSLISSGVGLSLHEYLGWSYVYMILIGTFIGSIGSRYIVICVTTLAKAYVKTIKSTENEANRQ